MAESYTKEAYKQIYEHPEWKKTATEFEDRFAANLYKTPYVQEAARTALSRISNMLTAAVSPTRFPTPRPAASTLPVIFWKRRQVFKLLRMQKKSTRIAGGFSFSGIALILLAAHKCAFCWPASHAFVISYP